MDWLGLIRAKLTYIVFLITFLRVDAQFGWFKLRSVGVAPVNTFVNTITRFKPQNFFSYVVPAPATGLTEDVQVHSNVEYNTTTVSQDQSASTTGVPEEYSRAWVTQEINTPPQTDQCGNHVGGGAVYDVAGTQGAAATGSLAGGGHSFTLEFKDWCSEAATSKFRTFNGTCNHPRNMGAAFTPFSRLLPPEYDDGFDSPRQKGQDGLGLPSPRLVSTLVHPSESSPLGLTHMFVQWGQWLDHDMTGIVTASNRQRPIKCCGQNGTAPPFSGNNPFCFPIELPDSEPHFHGKCMEFVRSLPANDSHRVQLRPREQMNSINAFIDGSQVYGSTQERAELLREKDGFLLRSKGNFPPESQDSCIKRPDSNDYCFLTGDLRVHENPALTSLHVIWFREHNRLANQIKSLKPELSNEDIYQITRRICGALQQVISFNYYLPLLLGKDAYRFRLISKEGRSSYNPDLDPRIFNAFSAAAMRFGHSTVPSSYLIGDRVVSLIELFNRPAEVIDNLDDLLVGLAAVTADSAGVGQSVDRNVVEEMSRHLFEPANSSGKNGLDLVALNIQRGRDHGLPPYTKWRTFCGLRPISGTNDTEALGKHASQLLQVYRSVHDVDLFTGIIHEPADTGVLGPTGRCLLGLQFVRAKLADRHFFDTDNPSTAFTDDQLASLRNTTLSKVLCLNTEIKELPLDVFKFIDQSNPLVPCSQLRQEALNPKLFV